MPKKGQNVQARGWGELVSDIRGADLNQLKRYMKAGGKAGKAGKAVATVPARGLGSFLARWNPISMFAEHVVGKPIHQKFGQQLDQVMPFARGGRAKGKDMFRK